MSSKSKVCFFFQEVTVSLASRSILKNFILLVFKKEGRKLDFVNFIFCTDKVLLKINQDYLNHDSYTDIITFDLSKNKSIQSEIYISIDRVRENARKLGVSFKSELHRVVFHGVLHLCGYNDKTKNERKNIRAKEDHYLKKYNIALSSSL
jgi:probable rRNA maturation factor